VRAPPDAAPYHAGDVVGGRYRVVEGLGSGPLGWVFRARDEDVDAEVALKVVRPHLVQTPAEREHFARTVRLSRKVAHTGVLRVYEAGEDCGRPYLTTPLLQGSSVRCVLAARQARGRHFTPREAEALLSRLAAALDAAHRVGPHGDLKPENVLLLPESVRVTDFALGLAIPRRPFVQAQRQARADAYLAPEALHGEPERASDVYALGVLLGELLTGARPEGGRPVDLVGRAPALPLTLDALYRRALHPDPGVRPPSAGALAAELADLLRAPPAGLPRPPPSARAVPGLTPVPPPAELGLPPPPPLRDPEDLPTVSLAVPAELAAAPARAVEEVPWVDPPPSGSERLPASAEPPSRDADVRSPITAVLPVPPPSALDEAPSLQGPLTGLVHPGPAGAPAAHAPLRRRERTEVLASLPQQVVARPRALLARLAPSVPGAAALWRSRPFLSRARPLLATARPLLSDVRPLATGLRPWLAHVRPSLAGAARPSLWLAVLAMAGVGAGVLTGLWLLQRLPAVHTVVPLPPEADATPPAGAPRPAGAPPPAGGTAQPSTASAD
jgi:serine/threonine protein kinase